MFCCQISPGVAVCRARVKDWHFWCRPGEICWNFQWKKENRFVWRISPNPIKSPILPEELSEWVKPNLEEKCNQRGKDSSPNVIPQPPELGISGIPPLTSGIFVFHRPPWIFPFFPPINLYKHLCDFSFSHRCKQPGKNCISSWILTVSSMFWPEWDTQTIVHYLVIPTAVETPPCSCSRNDEHWNPTAPLSPQRALQLG